MERTSDPDVLAAHRDRLAVLGQIAARSAHEINGQLMALFHVLASTRDLVVGTERGGASPDPAALLRQLNDADEALRRVARISHGITAYARKPSEEIELFAVDDAVGTAVRLAENFVGGVATVHLHLQAAGVSMSGRADSLSQIVTNLLLNAAQAIASEGGTAIWVETRCEGSRAVVRVRDDGPGVPAELRAAIFEPWVTTKAERGGSGLGLAICRELAARDGGRLELVEHAGRGAIFELHVPIAS